MLESADTTASMASTRPKNMLAFADCVSLESERSVIAKQNR
jgi:hypothetical protein